MSSLRAEKIGDELKKEISLIINKEAKDPRLQNINITAVKVSDDIGIATVFYTVIGESIIKDHKAVCPPIVGNIASGFSFSIIFSTDFQ